MYRMFHLSRSANCFCILTNRRSFGKGYNKREIMHSTIGRFCFLGSLDLPFLSSVKSGDTEKKKNRCDYYSRDKIIAGQF